MMFWAFTNFAGRRGEIAWKKTGFWGGRSRRDYDAYRALGFVAPVVLLDPVHTFHWSQEGKGRAIRLNPERGFRLRAYLNDWCGLGSILLIFPVTILPVFGLYYRVEQDPRWVFFLFLTLLCLMALIACILVSFWLLHGDVRDQNIRLLLGKHTWGSSDPAYWHPELLDDVKPAKAFRVPSFETLARRFIAERKWCQAMWAARLCTAMADEESGENLTSEILETPQVASKLRQARKNPSRRDAMFGETPPLSTWVEGIPEKHVFAVGG